MKLVIEYDPWREQKDAERAAQALSTLGMPAELREIRLTREPDTRTFDSPRVVEFEPAPPR
jgi:hypothetical protein